MTINEHELEDSADRLAKPFTKDGVATRRAQKFVAAGGVLGALAASSCCIAPLILFSLGVSGALTRLAPYQPYFTAVRLPFTICGQAVQVMFSTASVTVFSAAKAAVLNRTSVEATAKRIFAMGSSPFVR